MKNVSVTSQPSSYLCLQVSFPLPGAMSGGLLKQSLALPISSLRPLYLNNLYGAVIDYNPVVVVWGGGVF